MAREIVVNNLEEMQAFAFKVSSFVKKLDNKACVFLLYGDLGAGKTAFSRFFIQALLEDVDAIVPSPTFTLMQDYQAPCGKVHHYDLYRVEDVYEFEQLNIAESFAQAITLVEWPQRLGDFLPQRFIKITIKHHLHEDDRLVELDYSKDERFLSLIV